MIPLIEDQIHQYFIAQEAKRCAALEATNSKKGKTRGKKIERKKIPKPWRRAGPSALCQEGDFLMLVDKYDYDLADEKFEAYCYARGVLHLAGEKGSKRWKYFADYSKTKSSFLADPYFQLAEEVNGARYRYSSDELETAWQIVLLGRAKFQDCWELFSRKQPERE